MNEGRLVHQPATGTCSLIALVPSSPGAELPTKWHCGLRYPPLTESGMQGLNFLTTLW